MIAACRVKGCAATTDGYDKRLAGGRPCSPVSVQSTRSPGEQVGAAFEETPQRPALVNGSWVEEKPNLAKEEAKLELEGIVIEALPNTMFKVRLENGHEVLAYLSGRMKKFYIKVLLGDRVNVEVSPYDLTRGRVTYRHKARTRAEEAEAAAAAAAKS